MSKENCPDCLKLSITVAELRSKIDGDLAGYRDANEKIRELRKDLDRARELICRYEQIIDHLLGEI
jgi:hypothetical protein